MGTNYYAHFDCCEKCNRPSRVLHIGKSSGGWAFSLATHPEDGILDWPDWMRELSGPNVRIQDEYGDSVTLQFMIRNVTKREKWDGLKFKSDEHSFYDPEISLMRHRVGRFCAKNGDGTWDCLVGEFS